MKRFFAILLLLAALLSACTPAVTSPVDTSEGSDTSEQVPDSVIPPVTPPDDDTFLPCDLIVSEVMPDNKHLILGHDLDWIEIHNRTEAAVRLDDYALTDDTTKPNALPLTGKTIEAGGYLVIVLEEEAPFHLSSLGETVSLTYRGQEIAKLTYPADEEGSSYGSEGALSFPTPGFANTEEGYLSYLDSLTLPDLIISEVLSSNDSYLPQQGNCFDLVEVQNRSSSPILLSDYTLSDKRKEPERYRFPNVTLEPGQCYVVFCSGAVSLGENHASFKISSAGETIYLSKGGVFTDILVIPGDLKTDESYGRSGNRLVYFSTPTPGAQNGTGTPAGISAPTADSPSGIYDEAVTVTLSGSGTVHYTLDGSLPTTSSPVYTNPLLISGVTTIRAICVKDGRNSDPVAYTYIVGKEHPLPIVSVAISQDKLTGTQGVLNHISESYEYEAMLTLIEDGKEQFSVPFGFRLHGNDSRKGEKQNFQLRFRSQYGMSRLKYPVFADRDITEFKSLLLKGGSEDYPSAMIRDELAANLVDGNTNLYAQAVKPVVLYLGGEYWGVYYLRERYSDDYCASHLGVSSESVDLLYSYGGVQAGSAAEYNSLLSFCRTNNMSLPENYAALCEKVDINSLMDWYICRSYMGDKDLANIRYFRSDEGDGKWRWCYFDLDWAFWHTTDKPLSSIIADPDRHTLILAALASEQGKDVFLKRYAHLMKTVLNETSIIAEIDRLAGSIQSEMPADRERWGYSVSRWETSVESLRTYVRDGARDRTVLADLQEYFSLTDAEINRYFG